MDKGKLLAVARGDEPADLVLRGGRVVNVFSGEIETAALAIVDGLIAGVGDDYAGREMIDLAGAFVAPGADRRPRPHRKQPVHPAAICPGRRAARRHHRRHRPARDRQRGGHGRAAFHGAKQRGLPLSVVVMASSCVPATHMETSGATLTATELAHLLAEGAVYGLAEVMNFPGVVNGDPAMLAKLAAFAGGHAMGTRPPSPASSSTPMSPSGIGSEHECTTVAEAREKLARGLYILIREATNAHNLHALLPMIDAHNDRRICFCTDDRIPGDLIDQGTIDYMVREAIRFGIPPITALRMATLNTTEWFGLHDRGAIAPGRRADLIVCDEPGRTAPAPGLCRRAAGR
jgi:adenine deaminase